MRTMIIATLLAIASAASITLPARAADERAGASPARPSTNFSVLAQVSSKPLTAPELAAVVALGTTELGSSSSTIGKIDIPFGIFNEIRDVGTVLP